MFIEVRSEYEKGKLLFQWDPERNLVCIVLKDMRYCVKLGTEEDESRYQIMEKADKRSATINR